MGTVLFVRDPSGLQEHVDQLKHEKEQIQKRCDELTKAKEVETLAKQAEMQARAAEQQAKERALAQSQTLEADKVKLVEIKDQALAQVQQLKQEKEQIQKRCDELAKAKEVETLAREKVEKLPSERQAKIKLLDQRLQILQTNMNNGEGQYRSLQAELLKAEAQIELITAFVLRDPAH